LSDAPDAEALFAEYGPVSVRPLSRFQKIVATRLTENAQTIPHVTHNDEIDISAIEAHRRTLDGPVKITTLIFLIKAVVDALKTYPTFNASLTPDGSKLVLKDYFHIGIAVDGPLGLLVPVLRDCERKDVPTLAAELAAISTQARAKGLSLDAMSGGCFSISSLGGIGGTSFSPIINAPEVAILGVTRAQVRPVWDGSAFVPRTMLPLSLSYDHRVINGADAARFCRALGDGMAAMAAA
jgi:pyruvate dehydrogenase E2 component (dihydrolipoamide acetyltransferase)